MVAPCLDLCEQQRKKILNLTFFFLKGTASEKKHSPDETYKNDNNKCNMHECVSYSYPNLTNRPREKPPFLL